MTNSAWQATLQDEDGNIIPSAEVLVVKESNGQPATLFSSRAGASLTNPFFANSDGFAQFYTTAGEYRVTATNSGTGQANTWRYVRLGDAGARDVGAGSEQVPTNADLPSFGTAASANVQTSPTDATAGRLLNNETTAIGGFINYTGANLNPNVFGGVGIGDVVATGIASTATILNVFLPISGVIAPSSITVTSTFSIFDITGAGIAGGVTPVLGSISSNKVALVQFTGITGLTVNSTYTVRSDNSGSSIEVNF